MTERLQVSFTPGEGALVRMLGLVERRGFALRGVTMSEASAGASLDLEVEPRDPSRNIDVVARQLERLVDVRSVAIATLPRGRST